MKKKKKFHSTDDLIRSILLNKNKSFSGDVRIDKTENYFKRSENMDTLNLYEYITPKHTYSRKYLLKLTKGQIRIIRELQRESIDEYNRVLCLIKEDVALNKEIKLNEKKYRDRSKLLRPEKCVSKVHMLDQAGFKAVRNYKSALSNLKNGNISSFRLRYYSHHKKYKTVFFEKSNALKGNKISCLNEIKILRKRKIRKVKLRDIIKSDFFIREHNRKFYLITTFNVEENKKTALKEEFISIDPGVTPFLSGVSDCDCYFAGDNHDYLIGKFKRIDNINSRDISQRKKNRMIENINRRLRNKTDDFHWKTIKFLTSNFKNILIGDVSSKSIISRKINGMSRMSKRILSLYSLYLFKQRLKYKAEINGSTLFNVNEYYTSKTCSNCGHIKTDLGKAKLYSCNQCNFTIHRDLNGARNILNVHLIDRNL